MRRESGIEIEGLCKSFPRSTSLLDWLRNPLRRETVTALARIDLVLEPGAIYGLVGANGAGKTTLLKVLAGLVLPTSGTVRVRGVDVVAAPRRARDVVGLVVADERSFYWRLSVRENLRFYATLQKIPRRHRSARVEECLERVGLLEHAARAFRELSTGLRQRLAIARGILAHPDVLLMDEATRSLDPAAARRVRELVRDLAGSRPDGIVLYSTHVLSEVEELCDESIVLDRGRVVARQPVGWAETPPHRFFVRTSRPLPADLGRAVEGSTVERLSPTTAEVAVPTKEALETLLLAVVPLGLVELAPRRGGLEDLVLRSVGEPE